MRSLRLHWPLAAGGVGRGYNRGELSGAAVAAARRAGSPCPEQMDRKMLRFVEKRGVRTDKTKRLQRGQKCCQRIDLRFHHLSKCTVIGDQPRNPPKSTEKRIRINFPFPCLSRGQLPPVGGGSFRGYAFVMIFLAGVILLHAPRPRREGGQLRVHRGGTGRPLDETLMPVTSRAGARLPQTRHACPCFGRAVRARGEGGRTHHEGRAEPASVRLLKDFRSFRNSAGRFGKPRVESNMPTPALGIVGGVPGVREIGRGLVRNKVKRPRNSQESDFVP